MADEKTSDPLHDPEAGQDPVPSPDVTEAPAGDEPGEGEQEEDDEDE